jgi:hypothetical protein
MLGQVNEGPFVTGTEDAIRRAEQLDQVRRGKFAPVFLLVPAVYVAALWLEDEQSTADLVMVMPPVPKDFTPFSAMPVPPFVASLERLAALVPAEDRKATYPGGG